MVAEGEELETNLLQASQRNPANSSELDEVFDTRKTSRGLLAMSAYDPTRTYSVFVNEPKNAVVYCTAIYVHSTRNEKSNPWASRPAR